MTQYWCQTSTWLELRYLRLISMIHMSLKETDRAHFFQRVLTSDLIRSLWERGRWGLIFSFDKEKWRVCIDKEKDLFVLTPHYVIAHSVNLITLEVIFLERGIWTLPLLGEVLQGWEWTSYYLFPSQHIVDYNSGHKLFPSLYPCPKEHAELLQLCLTLCNVSTPGYSVHGIL